LCLNGHYKFKVHNAYLPAQSCQTTFKLLLTDNNLNSRQLKQKHTHPHTKKKEKERKKERKKERNAGKREAGMKCGEQ
jgi:hypothetical protein